MDDLTFGVAIKATGDGSVTADAKTTRAEIDNLKKSTDELSNSAAVLARQNAEMNQTWLQGNAAADAARDKAWALANGYKDVGGTMVKTAEEVAGGMDKTAFATHRAYGEMVVLAREASRGNWSRMAGSLTVLVQGLSPLALGLAGVASAVAAAGYAWWEFAKDATDADHTVADVFAEDSKTITDKLEAQTLLLKQRAALAGQGIVGQSDTATQDITLMHTKILGLAEDIKSGTLDWNAQIVAVQELTKTTTDYNNLVNAQAAKQAAEKTLKDATHQGDGGKKLLEQAQQLDNQMTVIHEDTFTKWITKWKDMEDKLVAAHLYGTKEREQHEAAYTSFVNAETAKREAAAKAAEEKKKQHLANQMASENAYFAQVDAASGKYDMSAKAREDRRFKDDIIQYQKRYEQAQKDHALTLAEEEGFQNALDDIMLRHKNAQVKADQDWVDLDKSLRDGNYKDAMNTAAKMTAGIAMHNKAAFEVNKAAGIASAIIDTYQGVAGVLKDFPGPLGWAMAAAQAAMGFAQVSAIEGTSFGGGGGAGSVGGVGGSIPSLATTPGIPVNVQSNNTSPNPGSTIGVAQATQQINLTIVGAKDNPNKPLLSYNSFINDVIPLMKQAKSNGALVDFNVTPA